MYSTVVSFSFPNFKLFLTFGMQQILQQFLRSFEQFYEDILPSHGWWAALTLSDNLAPWRNQGSCQTTAGII